MEVGCPSNLSRLLATGHPIMTHESSDGASGAMLRIPMTVNHALPTRTWTSAPTRSIPSDSAVVVPSTTVGKLSVALVNHCPFASVALTVFMRSKSTADVPMPQDRLG